MKHVFTLALLFLVSTFASGQNIIEKHFTPYQNQDNFTSVHVSGKMFEMAVHLESDDNETEVAELIDFLQSITSFDMIMGEEVADAKSKYSSAIKTVANTHEELMSIDDNEGRATLFIDENNGIVREVVLVGTGEDKFAVLSLMGEIDLRQLSKMSQKIQQQGFRQMDRMFEHGVEDVKVYPNPVRTNSEINMEVPQAMVGGTATIYNMEGVSIRTVKVNDTQEQLSTQGLPKGNYIVEMKRDKVSIKKRFVVQ